MFSFPSLSRKRPLTIKLLRPTTIFAHSMMSHALVLIAYVAITLGVTAILFDVLDQRFQTKALLEQAESVAEMLAPDMASYPKGSSQDRLELNTHVQRWGRLISSGVWVVAKDGTTVIAPREAMREEQPNVTDHSRAEEQLRATEQPWARSLLFIPPPPRSLPHFNLQLTDAELTLLGAQKSVVIPVKMLDARYMSGVYAPIISNGTYLGAVFIHAPRFKAVETTASTRRALYMGAGIALLFALGVAYQTSRQLASPLKRMQEAALQISQGDFSVHLELQGPNELLALAGSLNTLNNRLDSTMRSLREESARFASLIEGMAEGVLAVDTRCRVILMNTPARQFLGNWKTDDGLSLTFPEFTATLLSVITEGQSKQLEVTLENLPNRLGKVVLAVNMAPIAGMGAVAVLRDATEERLYQELQQEFTANVSHELRTPLGLIQGYLEALQDGYGQDPAKARDFLGVVYTEAMRLRHMVEDLLTLSTLEADKTESELVDLSWLIHDVARTISPAFRQKGVELVLEGDFGMEQSAFVQGKPARLKQVLINLLDNALRYSQTDMQVKVELSSGENEVDIKVTDTGCGIPPEHLPFIFNRFYRVEKERGRDTGGTGLGLAIVKSIVEGHAGTVSAQSTPGVGSTFKVILPRV